MSDVSPRTSKPKSKPKTAALSARAMAAQVEREQQARLTTMLHESRVEIDALLVSAKQLLARASGR